MNNCFGCGDNSLWFLIVILCCCCGNNGMNNCIGEILPLLLILQCCCGCGGIAGNNPCSGFGSCK